MTEQNLRDRKEDAPYPDANHFLSKFLPAEIRKRASNIYFIVIKLPLILFAIVAGFIFEFIVELPFMALILLDYRSQAKRGGHL